MFATDRMSSSFWGPSIVEAASINMKPIFQILLQTPDTSYQQNGSKEKFRCHHHNNT